MRFTAFDENGVTIADEVFYSVGGGFILSHSEFMAERDAEFATSTRIVPYPFRSAAELLATAKEHNLTIAELLLANEVALLNDPTIHINRPKSHSDSTTEARVPHPSQSHRESGSPVSSAHWGEEGWDEQTSQSQSSTPPQSPKEKIRAGVLALWQAMQQCTERLNTIGSKDPLAPIDWVTVYAMAVNEENAAGGRVVTAPTNGAAGVIPAIANYYMHFIEGSPEEKQEGIIRYFLTAAAIGILYKENASISGAEVGCQGEVGVACSMAAGGLVAAFNGTNAQIEHAAEIAMEHNLGMTCDPIGGLVQIPCIERNGMGAVKAINACRMAMHESGDHKISLDQVIATMYQTGLDMQSRYKETSLAGLALNIIEC
jgi:L-serine dehydratase